MKTEAIDEARQKIEEHLDEIRAPINKHNRPRWHRARQGFPEPSVVVPHSGELNRAERRSQGRRGSFLSHTPSPVRKTPLMIRKSGRNRWTKKEVSKLTRVIDNI